MHHNDHKLQFGNLRLNTGERLFTGYVGRQWERLKSLRLGRFSHLSSRKPQMTISCCVDGPALNRELD